MASLIMFQYSTVLGFKFQQTDAVRRTGTIPPKEMAAQEDPLFPHYTFQAFGPIFFTVSPVRLVKF